MLRRPTLAAVAAFAGAAWMPTVALAGECTDDVCVRFAPSSVTVADSFMFTIDIVADINTPILGWGLDISISNPTAVNGLLAQSIGPNWFAVNTPDGDGLAGLAFPNPVSGSNVLLATLTFSTDQPGVSTLDLSVTPGDASEGFPLAPSGFGTFALESAEINVVFVPEPATSLLLVGAAVASLRARRRARS